MHYKFVVCTLVLSVFLLSFPGCFSINGSTNSTNGTINEEYNKNATNNNASMNSGGKPTDSNSGFSMRDYVNKNKGMLRRGMYVFIAVTVIILVYFGVRIYKAKKRRVKSYGLLSSNDRHMELSRLNSDSEDDYTVFEARPLR